MKEFIFAMPKELTVSIAKRLKALRRQRGFTQKEFATRCGVSLGSLKRFEQTGDISFLSLAKIAFALDRLDELAALFERKSYTSIEEVIRDREISRQTHSAI